MLIKKCIIIEEKIEMIKEIELLCLSDEGINVFEKEIYKTCLIAQYYSDYKMIKFENEEYDDYISSYNELTMTNKFNEIVKGINVGELKTINIMLNEYISEQTRLNNPITKLLSAFKTLDIESIQSQLKDLNLDKIKELAEGTKEVI